MELEELGVGYGGTGGWGVEVGFGGGFVEGREGVVVGVGFEGGDCGGGLGK